MLYHIIEKCALLHPQGQGFSIVFFAAFGGEEGRGESGDTPDPSKGLPPSALPLGIAVEKPCSSEL
jgi:hypothetical protein